MGRETKILMGFLATLVGVFLGVLSMKLLVPRPPAGAGPDVAFDASSAPATELVEPPTLSPRPRPTATPEAAESGAAVMLAHADGVAPADGRLTAYGSDASRTPAAMEPTADALERRPAPEQSGPAAPPQASPRKDPFVVAAAHEVVAAQQTAEPYTADPPAAPRDRPLTRAHAEPANGSAVTSVPQGAPGASVYLVQSGDSWWHLAETAYGDGRLYRALFAWNRVLDPRVSLAPGTRLEVPPRSRLEAAWPQLVPAR